MNNAPVIIDGTVGWPTSELHAQHMKRIRMLLAEVGIHIEFHPREVSGYHISSYHVGEENRPLGRKAVAIARLKAGLGHIPMDCIKHAPSTNQVPCGLVMPSDVSRDPHVECGWP